MALSMALPNALFKRLEVLKLASEPV